MVAQQAIRIVGYTGKSCRERKNVVETLGHCANPAGHFRVSRGRHIKGGSRSTVVGSVTDATEVSIHEVRSRSVNVQYQKTKLEDERETSERQSLQCGAIRRDYQMRYIRNMPTLHNVVNTG